MGVPTLGLVVTVVEGSVGFDEGVPEAGVAGAAAGLDWGVAGVDFFFFVKKKKKSC